MDSGHQTTTKSHKIQRATKTQPKEARGQACKWQCQGAHKRQENSQTIQYTNDWLSKYITDSREIWNSAKYNRAHSLNCKIALQKPTRTSPPKTWRRKVNPLTRQHLPGEWQSPQENTGHQFTKQSKQFNGEKYQTKWQDNCSQHSKSQHISGLTETMRPLWLLRYEKTLQKI